jgi:glyoxylase-like metal-dependent hydrolase (beta-lactamase superfamily II)
LTIALIFVLGIVTTTRQAGPTLGAQSRPPAVKSLRLYIFELGNIPNDDPKGMFDEPLKVAPGGCCGIVGHLIVHPKGTLLWDTGVVPDAQIGSGAPGTERAGKRSLKAQLAEIGYSAKDITYLGLSHYHFDHTANANDFRDATWIVQKPEWDWMFSSTKPAGFGPEPVSFYSALKNSKTIVLANIDEFDVFGDGSVLIKAAPGHTPGQQMLILKLPKTGPVMLAGDLYHFPEERAAQLVPNIEFDKAQSRASRASIEEYVKKRGMPLWIEHDIRQYQKLKKSPAYLE